MRRRFPCTTAQTRECACPSVSSRQAASEIGFPVVVKLCGPAIGHKTERHEAFGWASARFDDLIEVFVRTVAVARIVCPKSMVRIAAGREGMSRELQALCFMAGANSIFVGNVLLTTPNPEESEDAALFADLGLRPMTMKPQGETVGA